VQTRGAFDPGFFTDAADPFIPAGRLITGFASAAAFKSPGVNIVSAAKKRPEERDFYRWRGGPIDGLSRRFRVALVIHGNRSEFSENYHGAQGLLFFLQPTMEPSFAPWSRRVVQFL